MSWHFLPELAAEYSAGTCSAGDACVQSSSTSTQGMFCSQDKETDTCQIFQSGTTCEPSTGDRGMEWLTLYQAAFRAKTFHRQDEAQESKEHAQDSGRKWLELSVKYDRDSHSWRTHRCLFDEDLPQSSVTLPKWGMMRCGVLFRLRTAEHPTRGSGCGYWHTPRCQAARSCKIRTQEYSRNGENGNLEEQMAVRMGINGGYLNPTWLEWLMGFPVEWTVLDALEMHKFQSWQQQHGVS